MFSNFSPTDNANRPPKNNNFSNRHAERLAARQAQQLTSPTAVMGMGIDAVPVQPKPRPMRGPNPLALKQDNLAVRGPNPMGNAREPLYDPT